MSEQMTEQDWVFGYYTFLNGKEEVMVWYPDGEAGQTSVFSIFKGWRGLISGSSYTVLAAGTSTLNGKLPEFQDNLCSDEFRMMCEAENAKFRHTKAKKMAASKFKNFDIQHMRLRELKEMVDKSAMRNRRSKDAMIDYVCDFLRGYHS